MAWTVEFLLSAQKQIAKLDRTTQQRITSYFHNRVLAAKDPRRLENCFGEKKAACGDIVLATIGRFARSKKNGW